MSRNASPCFFRANPPTKLRVWLLRVLLPGLVGALGPGLGALHPVQVEGLGPLAFDQGDAKGSRKKVQPIMLEHLYKEGVAKSCTSPTVCPSC